MINSISKGNVVDYTVGVGESYVSGDAVVIGDMVGIAIISGFEGDRISVSLKGVFELAKVAGDMDQGTMVYWNSSVKKLTTTVSTNKKVGWIWKDALSADATAYVRLK